MSKYKVQHRLPIWYMQFFSATWKPEGRKSIIYYSNGIESKFKHAKGLSCSNYHYSRNEAEKAEISFHKMENNYPSIVRKILNGHNLTPKEYYGMILTMVDYHARNPSYKNLTSEENYQAYEIVSQGLMNEIFKDSKSGASNLPEMLKNLRKNWIFQPISSEEKNISSDHPSLFFSIDDQIAFIFLPIDPHASLVAIDKRKIQIINNKATEKDVAILNGIQAARCVKYVYSDHDLSEYIGEGKSLTKYFQKKRPKWYVKDSLWKPEFIDYRTLHHNFSFLKII